MLRYQGSRVMHGYFLVSESATLNRRHIDSLFVISTSHPLLRKMLCSVFAHTRVYGHLAGNTAYAAQSMLKTLVLLDTYQCLHAPRLGT